MLIKSFVVGVWCDFEEAITALNQQRGKGLGLLYKIVKWKSQRKQIQIEDSFKLLRAVEELRAAGPLIPGEETGGGG